MESIVSSLIAGGFLIFGALIGKTIRTSKSIVSFMQHFAAGVIFAAVSVELIPKVLSSGQKFDIALGFSVGVGIMLLVRSFGQKYESTPLGLITGIGVDLWIDGILITLSFLAAQRSGMIITAALCLEAVFLGIALFPAMKEKNMNPFYLFATFTLLAPTILFGSITGLFVVESLPKPFFEGTLAFGVAALLYLVTEELLVEAHKEIDSTLGSAAFFVGFLIVLILN